MFISQQQQQQQHEATGATGPAEAEAEAEDAVESNKDVDIPSLLDLENQQTLLDTLYHATGDAFVAAFKLCVLMTWSGEEGPDVSLDTHQSVLERLDQCKF